jgi:hypothetical protein
MTNRIEHSTSGPLDELAARVVAAHDTDHKPILILVEDESMNLLREILILRCFGFEVRLAHDYDSAMKVVDAAFADDSSRTRIAGVLIDCRLSLEEPTSNYRDGVRLADELKSSYKEKLLLLPYTRWAGDYSSSLKALELDVIHRNTPLWIATVLERLRLQMPIAQCPPDLRKGVDAMLAQAAREGERIGRYERLRRWQIAIQGCSVALAACILMWATLNVTLIHPILAMLALIGAVGLNILVRRAIKEERPDESEFSSST